MYTRRIDEYIKLKTATSKDVFCYVLLFPVSVVTLIFQTYIFLLKTLFCDALLSLYTNLLHAEFIVRKATGQENETNNAQANEK